MATVKRKNTRTSKDLLELEGSDSKVKMKKDSKVILVADNGSVEVMKSYGWKKA